MSRQVYVPVAITFEDGAVIEATADFEGAPWSFVDNEPNVWVVDDEAPDGVWVRDADADEDAVMWISQVLGDLEYPESGD